MCVCVRMIIKWRFDDANQRRACLLRFRRRTQWAASTYSYSSTVFPGLLRPLAAPWPSQPRRAQWSRPSDSAPLAPPTTAQHGPPRGDYSRSPDRPNIAAHPGECSWRRRCHSRTKLKPSRKRRLCCSAGGARESALASDNHSSRRSIGQLIGGHRVEAVWPVLGRPDG